MEQTFLHGERRSGISELREFCIKKGMEPVGGSLCADDYRTADLQLRSGSAADRLCARSLDRDEIFRDAFQKFGKVK